MAIASKQALVDQIAEILNLPKDVLGPGSKEHRPLLGAAAERLGLDGSGTKVEVARRLVEELGQPWDSDCWSKGHTITTTCLGRILAGLKLRFVSQQDLDFNEAVRKRRAEDRYDNPPVGNASPSRSEMTVKTIARDQRVVAFTLTRANGMCELCGRPGPFIDEHGLVYLEVHHIKPLASGGPDTCENTAALCPNCHRQAHFSREKFEIAIKLRKMARIRVYLQTDAR